MPLKLDQIKGLHDKAYQHGQTTRERASDDLVFYWVTQWDTTILDETQLQYRGEFNILRKAGRQILSDLALNPIQIDFEPIDENRDDSAELLDGLYRADDRNNRTLEAYDVAQTEAVACGVGAWVLCTEYATARNGDEKQVIRRRPLYEANNNCFWDPSAKLIDKSDANYVSILWPYTEDGYEALCESLGIDRNDGSSFANPEESYVFPWIEKDKTIYVCEFYRLEKVNDKILTLQDIFGGTVEYSLHDVKEQLDDLIDAGYSVINEKKVKRPQVTRYLVSGERILEKTVIAGRHIPVVPIYGERAFVEGEETYEGITRLAKDPQRLRNFQMSYLADIVSRSPRPKPIFFPEQIQGYTQMYEQNGADNNYPYLLQNKTDANGNPLPVGPVGQMPDTPIPQALMAMIELTRQAVEDVANPGIPQDIADPDLSGKAVAALQNRIDNQSYIYQHHMKYAKRRDGEIYASMAADIYDAPRKVTLVLPDGQAKKVEVMESTIDPETGKQKVLRDLTNTEFEVYTKIGRSYETRKAQTIDQLQAMLMAMPPDDPMRKALMLKMTILMDGVDFDDIRKYAKQQLILFGVTEPETDEEKALLQQAAQPKPDAAMVLAQAELLKGQAAMQREQREAVTAAADIEQARAKRQLDVVGVSIDAFNAQTGRQKVQVDAAKAGASIQKDRIDMAGKALDNQNKALDTATKEMLAAVQAMSIEELMRAQYGTG